jgi:hypothetical protein
VNSAVSNARKNGIKFLLNAPTVESSLPGVKVNYWDITEIIYFVAENALANGHQNAMDSKLILKIVEDTNNGIILLFRKLAWKPVTVPGGYLDY